jgi:hypothetical protein
MRIHQFLIAVDQVFNTLTSDGWADETLSAHAWRLRERSASWARARQLIDGLFFWQPNHCQAAYEAEWKRLQSSPEYRQWPDGAAPSKIGGGNA